MRHKKEVEQPAVGVEKPLLTLEKILPFKDHENPDIRDMADACELIFQFPETRMYLSLCRVVNKVCDEMDELSGRKILTDNKDDKAFDRINILVKSMRDYRDNFEYGRNVMVKSGIKAPETIKKADPFEKFHGSRNNQQE